MRFIIFALTVLIFSFTAFSQTKTNLQIATERAEKNAVVLKTFLALGSDSVPFEVFKKAKGVAVFENVTQLSLLLSKGVKGKGLLSLRLGDDWSIPTFVNFGSFGFEMKIADKKKFDIVCFIMTQYLVETLKKGKIKPDDINGKKIALGPIVKGSGADSVIENASMIYYTFQEGKISGLEFQNDGFFSAVEIKHDNNINKAIYRKKAETIISENPQNVAIPNEINSFRQAIIDGLKQNQ